jgi:hypothetical protein
MSIIKLHERLERIEAAYLQAIGDRFPEIVSWPVKEAAIFAAVPDATHEEIIEMLHRWRRKLKRQNDELERKGDEAMRALRERKW